MNCDCITRIDNKLKEGGMNYHLAPSIVFDGQMRADTLFGIETAWNEKPKRSRKKPPQILCTFCPFCGVKAAGKPEKTRRLGRSAVEIGGGEG